MYARFPCYDFLYTPNNNEHVDNIINAIRETNPERPIPMEKVSDLGSKVAARW